MIAIEHYEHAASVEGYGIEGDGDSVSLHKLEHVG